MSRLVLLPFHTTPADLQLEGIERDQVDCNFKAAKEESKASRSAALMISLGKALEDAYRLQMPTIIGKVRDAIPDAKTRVQRSYAWLMMATLEVTIIIQCYCT